MLKGSSAARDRSENPDLRTHGSGRRISSNMKLRANLSTIAQPAEQTRENGDKPSRLHLTVIALAKFRIFATEEQSP
jgi:hypothetical protein